MSKHHDYRFRIDAYTPETIPMARLAEYMGDLAELLGYKPSVHFVGLEPGSTAIVHRVDTEDVPKVETRLRQLDRNEAPPDVMKAYRSLDSKLANDNAIGSLTGLQRHRVIKFPGRDRPKPLEYGAFRQRATLQGVLVRIGGRDETAHATIQDGDTYYSKCSIKRDLARQLAPYLFGQPIRLHGSGRWNRNADGEWELLQYSVESFEPLDDAPLSSVLQKVREMLPAKESEGAVTYFQDTRTDEEKDDD
jgi:hypothetical protein